MESKQPHVRKSKTLFVRNLPFTTTNEKLEEAFSDIGPIKQCFVVKDKGSEKCKGYGYVAFSLFEDSEKAKEEIKSLDGRKLYISYADRKKDERKKRPKPKAGIDEEDDKDNQSENTNEKTDTESSLNPDTNSTSVLSTKSDKESKYLQAKTLVVTGWKENISMETLEKCLQKLNVKNVAKCHCPVRNRDEPTAFVRFKSVRDTKRGQRRLVGSKYEGMELKAVQLNKETVIVPQNILKKCRIIIRNLPFKCTEELLEKTFKIFGNISEVKIPQKPDGHMFGFGFVQFTDLSAASKAIQQMNAKSILGRPVAVDWAVPKDKFQAATKASQVTVKPDSDKDESESDEGSFSAESDEAPEEKETNDTSDNSDDDSSSDEGFGDDDDEEEEEEEDDREVGSDSDDDDRSEVNKKKIKKDQELKPARKSDVEEGRTLFIRNLSYDTEEESLSKYMTKYGKLAYCKVVVDPNTEHSKGTAFIQFKKKEDADKCLNEANDDSKDGGITIDGRKLSIAVAVNRQTALQYKDKKKKEKIDKRNLHLAREGMIRAGTQAAQGLAKDDLAKRMKVELVKRQKLKNPNIFVSSTRLCVRNLPVNVDEKQLKKVFIKAAASKTASVIECRIMRDMARVSGKGIAKSRGFGFVSFTEHQHAMQALRSTNNNPDLFGEQKRLIVEFSLENKSALVAKDRRLERIKARQESLKKSNTDEVKEKSSKDKKKKEKSLSDKFIGQTVITKGEGKQNIPKTLSSHWGPKIRHKPRPSQTENAKKKNKKNKRENDKQLGMKRKHNESSDDIKISKASQEPSKKKRKRPKEQIDAFDNLVNKYKRKLLSAQSAEKSSKWFS